MGLTWKSGNDKQTMYFLFVIKTRYKSVSCGYSKISHTERNVKIIFMCLARWDAREERNQETDDGFRLLWGIFNKYIKQNIIMAVFRKANFHSVDICRSMKNHSCKKDQGEKLIIQTLIFSTLLICPWGFKKKEWSAYYRILFTLKNIT